MPCMPRVASATRHPDVCLPAQKIVRFVGSFGSRCRGSFGWFPPLARRSGGCLMPTDTDRVIATLRHAPGLNDDELARQAGVAPRQVDHICRYLALLDRLRRTPGPDGKITNTLIDR